MQCFVPKVSIEQVAAFTALAQLGSFRAAARTLCLSEEGLRSRVLVLQDRLGTILYEKERGRRGEVCLTRAGRTFLDKATRFIVEAQALTEPLEPAAPAQAIRVVVSHSASCLLSADVLREFQEKCPDHTMRVSIRSDQQVAATLRQDASFSAGICTFDQPAEDLTHHYWTSLGWRLLAPLGHPFLRQQSVTLTEAAQARLIAFEPDSTMQQRIMEAFQLRGLAPRIAMEVDSTHAAIQLVEAGLGLALVPSPAFGVLAQGAHAGQVMVSDPIREIDIVVLIRERAASHHDRLVHMFMDFLLHRVPGIFGRVADAPILAASKAELRELRRGLRSHRCPDVLSRSMPSHWSCRRHWTQSVCHLQE